MKIILLILLLLCSYVKSFKLKNVFKNFAKETWRGFKAGIQDSTRTNINTNWVNEKIISATHVTRPLQGNIKNFIPADHHGIVLHTSNGNKWLLHNTPKSGVVITDAKHMSSKWAIHANISVKGHKTVSKALKSAGSASFRKVKCGYWKGKTCIGTAKSVEEFLQE